MSTEPESEPDADQQTQRADENLGPCSLVRPLKQIGSQWRLIILYELQDGELRFNELKRTTDASSRTLSRVLSDLGEMGFVNRRLKEDTPVATYYSLTSQRSLAPTRLQ